VLSDTTARAHSVRFSISASMFVYAERPVSFRRRPEPKHGPTQGYFWATSPRLGASPRARNANIRRSVWPRVSRSQSCTCAADGKVRPLQVRPLIGAKCVFYRHPWCRVGDRRQSTKQTALREAL
jgi:hypothetical protein